MKVKHFLFLGFSFLILLYFLQVINFYGTQKTKCQEAMAEVNALKAKIQNQKRDLNFLKNHGKEFNYLSSKGWFSAKSRLIAAEKVEQLQENLTLLNIIFEPQTQETFNSNFVFHVTKILIHFKTLSEEDIYIFMDKLLKEFPGILVLHELQENREEEMLTGHLIFNWISLGKSPHEQ